MSKGKSGKPKHLPWEKMKAEYISDRKSSYRAIAEKYGVSFTWICKKAADMHWHEDKVAYWHKRYEKSIEKLGREQDEALLQELKTVLNISDRIHDVVQDDPEQFNRHLVEEKVYLDDGGIAITTEERIFKKMDTRAIKDMLTCVRIIEDLKRSMMEFQRLGERQKHDIELQRLELERERLEFEKQKAEMNKPDASAVILIEGYQQGWEE